MLITEILIPNIIIPIFLTVYAPDMPHTLPISEFLYGLGKNLGKALQYWLHYSLVAIAWLGVVPLTSCEFINKLPF